RFAGAHGPVKVDALFCFQHRLKCNLHSSWHVLPFCVFISFWRDHTFVTFTFSNRPPPIFGLLVPISSVQRSWLSHVVRYGMYRPFSFFQLSLAHWALSAIMIF